MVGVCSIACVWLTAASVHQPVPEAVRQPLASAPAPVDNPLKGLVPYQGDVRDRFPHSLEFNYLPYSALVRDYDEFDWQPLEAMLDDIGGRGHQAVLRVYLEYPKRTGAIPAFLIRDGLKVHREAKSKAQSSASDPLETPDYEDPHLRRSLQKFLAAFGKRYDGDPRIGFLTAGLLGKWGEWHNYPQEELFASPTVQREVMDAYEAAFKVTPVLLRYPVGRDEPRKAGNAERPFGYHDDSFAWATLHTGKKGHEWFYMTSLQAAGPAAETKWKSRPIGGEIRPEAWGRVFDEPPGLPKIQDFRACVEATHATWLMDSGMFQKRQSAERIQRAEAAVRRMGYEFHAPAVTIGPVRNGKLTVKLELANRGVAPFYVDWRPEYGLLVEGKPVRTFAGSGTLTGLLPGDPPRNWEETLDLSTVAAGTYKLAVRVPNPLKQGQPVRFANATQDADAPGWLSLGRVQTR
jgi:hypothetical protein